MPTINEIVAPSDLGQLHIPNRADIERIADDTMAVIARDWGKAPDARLVRVGNSLHKTYRNILIF